MAKKMLTVSLSFKVLDKLAEYVAIQQKKRYGERCNRSTCAEEALKFFLEEKYRNRKKRRQKNDQVPNYEI